MKETNHIWSKKNEEIIDATFIALKKSKKSENQKAFNELMTRIIPGVKHYISRRLSVAIRNGNIPKGKYKVEDFIDELYILTYDHLHEVETDNKLHVWLFKKAHELLEDTKVEEDFDHAFIENIDNFSRPEWDAMEEKFSTDGDGDLVMIEEMDDLTLPKYNYTLQNVFQENMESPIIEKLNKEMAAHEINNHIDWVLHKLPVTMRNVFELHIKQYFSVEDIAYVKNISVEQVEDYLEQSKNSLRKSLTKKFGL